MKFKRKWMMVDKSSSFLSQRKMPKMALIHQKLSGDHLILSAPGKPELKVPIAMPGNKLKCRYIYNCCFFFKLETKHM